MKCLAVVVLLIIPSIIGLHLLVMMMMASENDHSSIFSPLSFSSSPCLKPCIRGNEFMMRQKEHGTSNTPVQIKLRWNCSSQLADTLCNYNRHYAEYSGYWEQSTTFLQEGNGTAAVTFYDSNTGNPLFTVPGRYGNRTFDDFIQESHYHGWPSFRNEEVNWKYVRVLSNGETISVTGTHLGHNLPDALGNRYCINLISIAGYPTQHDSSDDDISK